jgi:uncharacterized protein YggE
MTRLATLVLLIATSPLAAQVQGNFKRSQNNNENNVQLNQRIDNYRPPTVAGNLDATILGDNVVEYHVDVLSNQRAQSYMAIFNVIQLGKTADETNTALNSRLTPLLADLKNLGLKEEDIYIDMVNFLPKFEYDVSKKLFSKKTYSEVPIGFELQKNLHVRFANATVLDQIVAVAAKYEIYDIVKVDYFIQDSKSVYNQMRTAALGYVKEIKKAYQELMPLDSAYVVTSENSSVAYPGDRYVSYQAFSSQSLDPSQRADAKIDRADKPISQFYQAIPANDYDIVLNPEILEPCVQFALHLTVRFTIKERVPATKVKREKEYILVTPTGEVRTLKID